MTSKAISSRLRNLVAVAAVTTALLAACATNTTDKTTTGASAGVPGTGGTTVGFIFVGPKDDYGYNQAAYEGSQAVQKKFPNMKVLTAENVPEDDNATRVMEDMIDKGATIIFATSYGHLDPAM